MKKFSKGEFLNKKRVLDFLDSKGFYIVLLLCVGIITLTAYTVTKRNLSSYMENNDLSELTPPVTKTDTRLSLDTQKEAKNPTQNKNTNTNTKTAPVSKPSVAQTKPSAKPASKPVESVQVTNMAKPVLGSVTQEYAKNNLVYSKTLEEWTTHNGLDLSADRGAAVKAAFDGTVSDVYRDTMYGITIVLDHGNGIKTKYSNLSTDSMVKKGDKVQKGTVISGVGNTAIAESSEQPHLHFEVIQNGVSVNPKSFMKQ